jgi:hypothetical protein
MLNTESSIPQEEITLDNLHAGKFTIKDIPRDEGKRLWREEYEKLPEEARTVADTVGWKSKPFFLGKKRDGSEAEWKDWNEFAEDVRTKLPVANERLKHLSKEKLEADAKIEKLERQLQQMSKLQKMQLEKEMRNERLDVEREMKEAKEYQDFDRFEQARERKAQIELEEKTIKEFEQPVVQAPHLAPEVILFKANNPWFEKDRILTNYARGLEREITLQYPDLSAASVLRMVEDDVKANFPDKFTKKTEEVSAPAVESGRSSGKLSMPNGSKEMSFDQIPTKDQLEIERLIRHGIYKSKSEAVKEYNQKYNRK